eukprot:TRINITY_DN2638_c0_g1_i1.p1 TRINITY_DN2638_c0_g1~~TRINITY_DN2638_c0_g1_i1.p1  ORF type:complete len:370 (+),score=140.18 TRINITY_DN2638_c0_g1_i1:113-1222(+)
MLRSLVGSEMCIRDRYQRRVRGRDIVTMGCDGSKDEPVNKGDQMGRTEQPPADPAKMKIAKEVVDGLDTNKDGVMQFEEVQVLVKNLHPKFVNKNPTEITPDVPEMQVLNGMSKDQLVNHLATTVDTNWLVAFHQFLGLSGSADACNKSFEPGVYKVVWEGGVQYRKSNSYADVFFGNTGDKEVPIASTGQHYRIRHFVPGVMDAGEGGKKRTEVMYGYLEWPRLFLPMSFPDGTETLVREAEYENAEQLERMAKSLFDRILTKEQKDTKADTKPESVSADKVKAYLDAVKIGYDDAALLEKLAESDTNNDQLIDTAEFVNCFTKYGCIADCIWVDTNGAMKVPHPESVAEKFNVEDGDEFGLIEGEQM